MRVIAVCAMEHASLTKDAVYLINLIPPVERIDIGLGREE
jgi:hypothetical protein